MFPFSLFKRKKRFVSPVYRASPPAPHHPASRTNVVYDRYYPVQYEPSYDNGPDLTVVDAIITAEVLNDIATSNTYDTGPYVSISSNDDSFSGDGGDSGGGGASGSWDSGSNSYDSGSSSFDL